MTNSFITYSNDYLLINHIRIDLLGVTVAVILLVVLIYNYLYLKYLSQPSNTGNEIKSIFEIIKNFLPKDKKNLNNGSNSTYFLKYVLLSCFIVANSIFLVFFVKNIILESSRYMGLDYQTSVNLLETKEFNNFLSYLKTNLPKTTKISFNDPNDSFYKNVKYKFKLAYYLLPITISESTAKAEYIIIVNFKNQNKIEISVPTNKTPKLLYSSEHFKLLKLTNKPQHNRKR